MSIAVVCMVNNTAILGKSTNQSFSANEKNEMNNPECVSSVVHKKSLVILSLLSLN